MEQHNCGLNNTVSKVLYSKCFVYILAISDPQKTRVIIMYFKKPTWLFIRAHAYLNYILFKVQNTNFGLSLLRTHAEKYI
jgi:hypothetical protein